MQQTLKWIIGISLLTAWSCTPALEATPYQAHGIQFEIPEGWLEKEAPIPDAGVYIMVEKQGEDESGQFIVSVLDKEVPLNAYMQLMRKQLSETLAMQQSQISFTETELTTFAEQEALKANFKFTLLEKKYHGALHTFHCGDKTIYLFVQEAEEDEADNAEGFSILQRTLGCAI